MYVHSGIAKKSSLAEKEDEPSLVDFDGDADTEWSNLIHQGVLLYEKGANIIFPQPRTYVVK